MVFWGKSYCQSDTITTTKEDSTVTQQGRNGNLGAYLYEILQLTGNDNIEHVDPNFGYRIVIPKWWRIRETPNVFMLGGTFPAVDEIENALMLKAYDKGSFEDYSDFEKWVISAYNTGDTPTWSNGHVLKNKEAIEEFKDLGNSYKVVLDWRGSEYYCCYIIVETSKSFLWIDFTATEGTYEVNFSKFQEIMSSFEVQ